MVIGIIIAVIIVVLIMMYNGLVRKRTAVDNGWSQIDVQLQRRNDLIPNLVSTVKGYAGFERSTLEKVIKMRGQMVHLDPSTAGKSLSRAQFMNLSNQLSGALKSIFAVSERYPDLKANSDFQQLMEELTNTENKIAFSRQNYNNTVAEFNQSTQTFPGNLVAGLFHFTARQYLQVPESAKQTPNVNFNDLNK